MSQLVLLIVFFLAWFFLKWLDRRRAATLLEADEINWQKTKRTAKIVAVGLVLLWGFQSYSEWSDAREVAKARAALTPQQRAAADAVERQRAEAQAKAAQAEAREKPFREACMRRLLEVLNDPGSAQLAWSVGSFNSAGVFNGFIEGRAKNGFGALMLGSWHCEAVGQGSAVVVISMRQISP